MFKIFDDISMISHRLDIAIKQLNDIESGIEHIRKEVKSGNRNRDSNDKIQADILKALWNISNQLNT